MTSPTSSSETDNAALPPASAGYAFFLDVDGTLLGIRERPEEVTCPPEVRSLLESLYGAAAGAVALISGRQIAVLDQIFAPLRLPSAGLHGAERRDAHGKVHRARVDQKALARVHGLIEELARQFRGVLLEDKGLSLALHYRSVPSVGAELGSRLSELVAGESEYTLQKGKMVWELRPRGQDKGAAIAAFLDEPPFAGRRPVFAGDDATDEDGFQLVNKHDGYSIHIGTGETSARFSVAARQRVLRWLLSCARQTTEETIPS